MRRMVRDALLLVVTATATYCCAPSGYLAGVMPVATSGPPPTERIRLPRGFRIGLYASDVEGARSLTLGPRGLVFVGSRDPGNVYALVDRDEDARAEEVVIVADDLESPNGVAFHEGALFVAEPRRVLRFDRIADSFRDAPRGSPLAARFPEQDDHEWKFIAFGPDGKLYVPIGAPCNACGRGDPFASIMRMNADGSALEVYARGIRNTVGFDWQPGTGVLWFTDNGRDWMGDDAPPDELDRAPRAGLHFGFPYCHGSLRDPDHRARSCTDTTAPALELAPHAAALGMRFYDGEQFPPRYRGGIFIAEHGSWNRDEAIGYRLTFVPIEGERARPFEVFAEGFLGEGPAWGRPVDVLVMPDGALLVSDDKADAVYRITYGSG